jgi:hypothetical protein
MALVTFWLIVGPARRWLGPRAALFVLGLGLFRRWKGHFADEV